MSNVKQKNTHNVIEIKRQYDESVWRNLIRDGILAKVREGVKIKNIAEDTGLCLSTISKLIYNETKYPRFMTIIILMKYLGYRMWAEK